MQVSQDGTKFVTFSTDRRLRVFDFKSGKLKRSYDESLEVRVENEGLLAWNTILTSG